MRLLEFLKWKTAAEKEDLDRWACGVTKWKDQAEEHVCKLYTDGTATLTLRRAAAQVAKFTAELSLHSWAIHQNPALRISPDTAVVLQELPKHGLEGQPRHAEDAHRKHKYSVQFFTEVAETMECSRRQDSNWREGDSEGASGEGSYL